MTCSEIIEQISALYDGELPPAEVELVELHFKECDACRVERDRIRRLLSLTALIEPEETPAELHGQILARLATASASPAMAMTIPTGFMTFLQTMVPPRAAWSGAAAIGVFALGAFVLMNQSPSSRHSPGTPQPAAALPESVRRPAPSPNAHPESPAPGVEAVSPATEPRPGAAPPAEGSAPAELLAGSGAPASPPSAGPAPVPQPRVVRQERRVREPGPLRQAAPAGTAIAVLAESAPPAPERFGEVAPSPVPGQPHLAGMPVTGGGDPVKPLLKDREPPMKMAGMMPPAASPMPSDPKPDPGDDSE